MRKFTFMLFLAFSGLFEAKAQTVATFDTLTLPKADTFYVNYNSYGNDVGFDDGLAHFQCVYDTFPGGFQYWNYGFAYSNMTDSLTAGFMNGYSSITGKGYDNSAQYLVYYGDSARVNLKGKAIGQPVNGFYIANNAYTYYSMRDGDAFAKKFGGVTGSDSDWYCIKIYGYNNGQLTTDSVEVALADFRFQNNALDTIYRGWRWVNLLPLGKVDSLLFKVSSSDAGMFGINTPKYFCMDNFSTYETSSVEGTEKTAVAKVYPNPAINELYVELNTHEITELYVTDIAGRMVRNMEVEDKVTLVSLADLQPGIYLLHLKGENKEATVRFVKQ